MSDRIEHDTLGDVRVPADRYWGAQTQRSTQNFGIGGHRMPTEVIHALAILKKAAALTNCDAGLLSPQTCRLIGEVCDEILAGRWHDEFPLVDGELMFKRRSGSETAPYNAAARRNHEAQQKRGKVRQRIGPVWSRLARDDCDGHCSNAGILPASASDRLCSRTTRHRDTRGE